MPGELTETCVQSAAPRREAQSARSAGLRARSTPQGSGTPRFSPALWSADLRVRSTPQGCRSSAFPPLSGARASEPAALRKAAELRAFPPLSQAAAPVLAARCAKKHAPGAGDLLRTRRSALRGSALLPRSLSLQRPCLRRDMQRSTRPARATCCGLGGPRSRAAVGSHMSTQSFKLFPS